MVPRMQAQLASSRGVLSPPQSFSPSALPPLGGQAVQAQEGPLPIAGEAEAVRACVALVIALGRLRHFREAVVGLQVCQHLA